MPSGNKPPRRHHFVPQHALRRFKGDDGILWTYDFQRGKIYPADTRSTAFERDLYSVIAPSGDSDHATFERILAERIDGPGNSVISRLLRKEIVGAEIIDFFRYVTAQIIRTPSHLKRMSALAEPSLNESVKRIAKHDAGFRKSITERILSEGGSPEIIEAILQSIGNGEVTVKPNNNFLIPQAFALIENLTEIAMEMRWQFLDVDDSDPDLFVGDHPVLLICPDGEPVGLKHPKIDLVLPISNSLLKNGSLN